MGIGVEVKANVFVEDKDGNCLFLIILLFVISLVVLLFVIRLVDGGEMSLFLTMLVVVGVVTLARLFFLKGLVAADWMLLLLILLRAEFLLFLMLLVNIVAFDLLVLEISGTDWDV